MNGDFSCRKYWQEKKIWKGFVTNDDKKCDRYKKKAREKKLDREFLEV